MAATSPSPPLCLADDATFWPWRTWTKFALESPEQRQSTTVIVPIVGLADWGLGHPLDVEEVVLMSLLREALPQRPAGFVPLVVPPLRFVLGPDPQCAFAVDPPTAHAFLREVALSVQAAGYRRVILFNSSPWNEELCAAASRDLRIELGLQIFRIHLSGLDLDLHPVRSRSRRDVQTLATALLGRAPDAAADATPTPDAPVGSPWGDEHIRPLAGTALSVAQAAGPGANLLAAAAQRLAALWREIAAHPALPRDGALLPMPPP